jgi:hypothetical protein
METCSSHFTIDQVKHYVQRLCSEFLPVVEVRELEERMADLVGGGEINLTTDQCPLPRLFELQFELGQAAPGGFSRSALNDALRFAAEELDKIWKYTVHPDMC